MSVPARKGLFSLLPPVAALALWILVLGQPWGSLPAMGKFLSPAEGFWRNAETRGPQDRHVPASGLNHEVVVEYDANGIPHVFAGGDLRGLFFAQGYVTARDRLWQMDIQSRAGMGRLSEIMGPSLVDFDLERRRMGMPLAARASLSLALEDSLSRIALEGYTDGVNAWISSLNQRTWPLEFKLLQYAPEPWTPLKSMALIGNMKWTLSQGHDDLRLTRVADSLGEGFFRRNYPDRHPGSEPILPPEVMKGAGDRVERRETGDGGRGRHPLSVGATSRSPRQGTPPSPVAGLNANPSPASLWQLGAGAGSGSNNFVLSGSRTRAGFPLLANDPHLDLTLPSTWYAIQLHGGGLNAMGVSLPGVPGIVIGFTRTTAWGLTNGMNDVFDWVGLEFRDEANDAYRWNDEWRVVRRVQDTVFVRGGEAVVDTQLWTHPGPVPVHPGQEPFGNNTPQGHALQWTALDPSNELGAFLRLLTARDYPEFRDAVSRLETPSQNIVFAADDGIAMVHQGRVPVKASGQGRRLLRPLEGEEPDLEWTEFIPGEELPAARNPARGWLASANQEVTGPDYPYWLGAHFYPSERARRLHRLLEPEYAATPEWARGVMFDSRSSHADIALPLLLAHLDRPVDALEPPGGIPEAIRIEASLREWDRRYRAEAVAPVHFERWWNAFYRRAWEESFGGDTTFYVWPSRQVTLDLLAGDSADAWSRHVRAAFSEAVDSARITDELPWGRHRPVSIPHLLRLRTLGVHELALDGCRECLNAQRGSHGPSWRMVVQLPDPRSPKARPEAWGIYPGGQTGNPGSPAYTGFVDDWASGKLRPLRLRLRAGDISDTTAWTLTLGVNP